MYSAIWTLTFCCSFQLPQLSTFLIVRAKTFIELWLYIVCWICYAFDADIINRLIIWQLGRGSERTTKGQQSLLSLSLLAVRRNTKKRTQGGWANLSCEKREKDLLRGGSALLMCENVMNIALIANHGQVNVLSANTTILRRLTMMNDNPWPFRRHRVHGKQGVAPWAIDTLLAANKS